MIASGELATCSVIELEILYSTRSANDLRATNDERSAIPRVAMVQSDFDRATRVMERLADRGRHRSVGIPDLLIAAVAERADLTLLHYDSDFDTVASVTRQATEWVVPRGSVP